MLPGFRATLSPIATLLPIAIPSVADTSVVSPPGNFTLASGAECTGECTSSVTSPTMSVARGMRLAPGKR